jgi:hypothetical protein
MRAQLGDAATDANDPKRTPDPGANACARGAAERSGWTPSDVNEFTPYRPRVVYEKAAIYFKGTADHATDPVLRYRAVGLRYRATS